ncbi:MAG: hypothetical protein KGZ25_16190 [Planctomycetes bacterium]|nr:hypothetical protein [Planctomycetota bacterium]
MYNWKKIIALFGILSLMVGSISAQDVAVHIQSEKHKGEETKEVESSTLYISGKNVKGVTEDNSGYFIFRGDEKTIWFVEDEKETATEISEEAIKKISAQLDKIRKTLDDMPEEQREMVKRMMQQKMKNFELPPEGEKEDLKLKRTEQTKTINDYSCKKVEVWKGSAKIADMWIAEWDSVQYTEELKSAYVEMAEFAHSLRSILSNSLRQNYIQMPITQSGLGEEAGGMPICTVHYTEDNEIASKTTVKKIEAVDLSEESFRPPENYKLTKPQISK